MISKRCDVLFGEQAGKRRERDALLANVAAADQTWEEADQVLRKAFTEDEVITASEQLMKADEAVAAALYSACVDGVPVRRVARTLGWPQHAVRQLFNEEKRKRSLLPLGRQSARTTNGS